MFATGPRAVGFTIVWPEGVIFGSIMTYHVQILLLVRQPLFDRAALLLTQTSWVLPPLSVGKMTLRLYGALNYSHGLSKGPSFGTGRGAIATVEFSSPVPSSEKEWRGTHGLTSFSWSSTPCALPSWALMATREGPLRLSSTSWRPTAQCSNGALQQEQQPMWRFLHS